MRLPAPIHIAIPVKNEEEHLEGTLEALRVQMLPNGERVPWGAYSVLLLANNCSDRSVEVAQRFGKRHPGFPLRVREVELPREHSHVGWARRLAMDEASLRGDVVATTDADTQVARNWLGAIWSELAKGADAVCGRILLDDAEAVELGETALRRHRADEEYRMLLARVEDRLDPLPHDAWERHFQHYGASFALRSETYWRVGGLPALPGLEDVALYEALLAIDARVRHSPAVRVTTSSRRKGRSPIGLSEQLSDWCDPMRRCVVESAELTMAWLALRGSLRGLWAAGGKDAQAVLRQCERLTGWGAEALRNELVRSRYFGRFVASMQLKERMAERWPDEQWQTADSQVARLRETLRRWGALGVADENIQTIGVAHMPAHAVEFIALEK